MGKCEELFCRGMAKQCDPLLCVPGEVRVAQQPPRLVVILGKVAQRPGVVEGTVQLGPELLDPGYRLAALEDVAQFVEQRVIQDSRHCVDARVPCRMRGKTVCV